MALKIAICDDELVFARKIESTLNSVLEESGVEAQVDLFTDCTRLYESDEPYDMAFLDIGMTPYDGLTLAGHLQEKNPKIVLFFITAFDEYLDDALDISAFRYIPKPIDAVRLAAGIEKALDNIAETEEKIFFRDGQSFVGINTSSIILVQILGRHTEVVTEDKRYRSDNNMDFWTERLTAPTFFRVHKSYIINMKYVTDYSRTLVVLNDSYKIPIAYSNQVNFRRCFFGFFGG